MTRHRLANKLRRLATRIDNKPFVIEPMPMPINLDSRLLWEGLSRFNRRDDDPPLAAEFVRLARTNLYRTTSQYGMNSVPRKERSVPTQTADPLAEFKALSKPRRATCSIPNLIAELNADDQTAVQQALDADINLVGHAAISKWFSRRDIKVGSTTISRHRRKICTCGDD